MDRKSLLGAYVAVAGTALLLASRAHAVQGSVNGLGQGSAQAAIWAYPNQPPATPSFQRSVDEPFLALGPGLSGADPRTGVSFSGLQNWRTHVDIRAAMGDTADWHSMLPHVAPTSTDATGTMDVTTAQPFGPGSMLFIVNWGASDAGVAMHIGWFDGTQELFETPIMIGPFQRTDTYLISVQEGSISRVRMEVSAAATSIIPGPGALAVLSAGGLLVMRRRR
jgi:uncharacterized protein (TIGR03382 family)